MRIAKAFLYTILLISFWFIIQLVILVPVKYFVGEPSGFNHILGLTKILSVVGSFLIIYTFFWKPNLDINKALTIQSYDLGVVLCLLLMGVGLFLLSRPFWDFGKIIMFYRENSISYRFVSNHNLVFIYDIIATLLIAPIVEELFYRKFLLGELVKKNSQNLSLIVSALCFTLIHIETPNNLMPAFVSGIVFGIVYLKTRKITYSITLHFIVNLIVMTTNNINVPSDNYLIGYNFNIIYWLLSLIGISMVLIGIRKISAVNFGDEQLNRS